MPWEGCSGSVVVDKRKYFANTTIIDSLSSSKAGYDIPFTGYHNLAVKLARRIQTISGHVLHASTCWLKWYSWAPTAEKIGHTDCPVYEYRVNSISLTQYKNVFCKYIGTICVRHTLYDIHTLYVYYFNHWKVILRTRLSWSHIYISWAPIFFSLTWTPCR